MVVNTCVPLFVKAFCAELFFFLLGFPGNFFLAEVFVIDFYIGDMGLIPLSLNHYYAPPLYLHVSVCLVLYWGDMGQILLNFNHYYAPSSIQVFLCVFNALKSWAVLSCAKSYFKSVAMHVLHIHVPSGRSSHTFISNC